MYGIILAAGRGSRLGEKTDKKPKCLLELAGKPLLHWQLEAMRGAGIDKIIVVRGYLGHMITGNFVTVDNPGWHNTNMVASLMCVKDWLKDETAVVSYADIIYDQQAVKKLKEVKDTIAMLYDINWLELWENRFTNPLDDAESFYVDEKGHVKDIGRKNVSLDEIHGQYMGLLKFSPESVVWIENILSEESGLCEKLDMTGLLQRLINKGYAIKGIPWDGAWCEIDDVHDLNVAEEMIKNGLFKSTDENGE